MYELKSYSLNPRELGFESQIFHLFNLGWIPSHYITW